MEKKKRRHFPDEFKRQAVERVETSGLPLFEVAAELGVHESQLRRETSERCPSSDLRASCPGDAGCFRTPGLPGSRPGAFDPAACCETARRRSGAHRSHHRSCRSVWSLRLSPDHGVASCPGLACECQAGRTDLAAGRSESASQATKTRSTMAQRRLLHPTSAVLASPCLGL